MPDEQRDEQHVHLLPRNAQRTGVSNLDSVAVKCELEEAQRPAAVESGSSGLDASRKPEARSQHRQHSGHEQRSRHVQEQRRVMRATVQADHRMAGCSGAKDSGASNGREGLCGGVAASECASASHGAASQAVGAGYADNGSTPDGGGGGDAAPGGMRDAGPSIPPTSRRAVYEDATAGHAESDGSGAAAAEMRDAGPSRPHASSHVSSEEATAGSSESDSTPHGGGASTSSVRREARQSTGIPRDDGTNELREPHTMQRSGAVSVRQFAVCVADELEGNSISHNAAVFGMIGVLQGLERGTLGRLGVLCTQYCDRHELVSKLARSLRCRGACITVHLYPQMKQKFSLEKLVRDVGNMAHTRATASGSAATDGRDGKTFVRGILFIWDVRSMSLAWKRSFFNALKDGFFCDRASANRILVVFMIDVPLPVYHQACRDAGAKGETLADVSDQVNMCKRVLVQHLGMNAFEDRWLTGVFDSALILKSEVLSGSDTALHLKDLGVSAEDAVADGIARELAFFPKPRALSLLRTAVLFLDRTPTVDEIRNAVAHQKTTACGTALNVARRQSGLDNEVQPRSHSAGHPRQTPREQSHSSDVAVEGRVSAFPHQRITGITLAHSLPPEDRCQFEVLVPNQGFGYCSARLPCGTHSFVDQRLNKLVRMTPRERRERVRNLENLALAGEMENGNGNYPYTLPLYTRHLNVGILARVTHPSFILVMVCFLLSRKCYALEHLVLPTPSWRALIRSIAKTILLEEVDRGSYISDLGLQPFYSPSEFVTTINSILTSLVVDVSSPKVEALRRVFPAEMFRDWISEARTQGLPLRALRAPENAEARPMRTAHPTHGQQGADANTSEAKFDNQSVHSDPSHPRATGNALGKEAVRAAGAAESAAVPLNGESGSHAQPPARAVAAETDMRAHEVVHGDRSLSSSYAQRMEADSGNGIGAAAASAEPALPRVQRAAAPARDLREAEARGDSSATRKGRGSAREAEMEPCLGAVALSSPSEALFSMPRREFEKASAGLGVGSSPSTLAQAREESSAPDGSVVVKEEERAVRYYK